MTFGVLGSSFPLFGLSHIAALLFIAFVLALLLKVARSRRPGVQPRAPWP